MAEAGPDWTTVITALSTISAAAIGALAGYLGAARASKQAATTAREQRRYELVHEMRVEVLPTLYADLRTLHDMYVSSTRIPLVAATEEADVDLSQLDPGLEQEPSTLDLLANETTQQVSANLKQRRSAEQQLEQERHEKLEAMKKYYYQHSLWIPEELRNPVVTAMGGIADQAQKYAQIYSDWVDQEGVYIQQWETELAQVREYGDQKFSQLKAVTTKKQVDEVKKHVDEVMKQLDEVWKQYHKKVQEIKRQMASAAADADARREEVHEWLRTKGEEQLRAVQVSTINFLTQD